MPGTGLRQEQDRPCAIIVPEDAALGPQNTTDTTGGLGEQMTGADTVLGVSEALVSAEGTFS